jgi:hypothetical protein
MKALAFAAALTLGSAAAYAQTGNTVSDPSQRSGPRGVTQQGTSPNGQACAPAGYNQGTGAYPTCGGDMAGTAGGTAAGGGTAASSSTGALPACSRAVTDHCVQTYERGVRRR